MGSFPDVHVCIELNIKTIVKKSKNLLDDTEFSYSFIYAPIFGTNGSETATSFLIKVFP